MIAQLQSSSLYFELLVSPDVTLFLYCVIASPHARLTNFVLNTEVGSHVLGYFQTIDLGRSVPKIVVGNRYVVTFSDFLFPFGVAFLFHLYRELLHSATAIMHATVSIGPQ